MKVRKNIVFPKKVVVAFEEGKCNLACPKCPVHGKNKRDKIVKGILPEKLAIKIAKELENKKGVILGLGGAVEPLAQKTFFKYVVMRNNRDIPVSINSNGLLIDRETAILMINRFKFNSIFISIDAMTPKTLLKVRGTDKIEKINRAVFNLLEERGNNLYPRIGVSFTIEKDNITEKDSFVEYWLKYVDVVRVNYLYEFGNDYISKDRKPCTMLYDTFYISVNGNVRLCCIDFFDDTSMGNINYASIEEIWNGVKFQYVRDAHEAGDYNRIGYCKRCNEWCRYIYENEYENNGILIRQSRLLTYYNRIDRLSSFNY